MVSNDLSTFSKNIFSNSFADGLTPDPDLLISEWAEQNFYLPESVSEPGLIRLRERTPYLIEPLDCLTPGSPIQEMYFMGGSQIAKTTMITILVAYLMATAPKGFVVYEPTGELIDAYVKGKLNPSIEASPSLKALFINKNNDTLGEKIFKGCTGYFRAAKSKNSFSSISVPYVLCDETDRWDRDVGGEGSPQELANGRRKTFGEMGKTCHVSTPTLHEMSSIEEHYLKGDQRRLHVPCPHCGAKQVLVWSNIRYTKNPKDERSCLKDSIYYECSVMGCHIKESSKTDMLKQWEWIPNNPDAPAHIRSYQLSALYSPAGWQSWKKIIDMRLQAEGDHEKLKAWTNTELGETWYEKAEQPSDHKLMNRAENYPLYEVNEKAVVLFGGVDTQDNRLHAVVIAIGEDGETWTIANEEIYGSPSNQETWDNLDRIIRRPYKHKSGVELYVKACAIDTGGHHTNDVYDFVRRNPDKYFAIKGASHDISVYIKESNKIDINPKTGKKFDNALSLYMVNTNLLKKYIYINLNNMLANDKTEGSKVIHFSHELQASFYKMLTVERLVKKIVNGGLKEEFINPKKERNEVLDCFVYAYAMAFFHQMVNLYGDTYKKLWDINIGKRLELIEKKKEDAKKDPNAEKEDLPPARKKSWINKGNWSLK